ncbi:MAG: asparagine synthase C-terminal domain-containing protein [Alphaproteobacteria bacterium]|nr:asparagine synthase C-terminal domain-containing protein [Alphaproteobacteria bacterium]
MPPGRVGVSMSGGLDSTTLAAAAVEVAGDPARVVADCVHFERLMPDDEKFFGMMAARQLGIELRTTAIDDLAYDPDWRMRSIPTPEPMVSIVHAHPDRLLNRAMAAEAGVWLFGEGPDNALRFERRAYLAWLFGQRRWGRLAQAAWQYLGAKGMGDWAGTLRRYTTRDRSGHAEAELPSWLTSDLVERSQLEDRLRSLDKGGGETAHPWHPEAIASFSHPVWERMFASCDLDETQAPFVWRHPFLDLRVLHFMLSVPPVPWARRKLLMREAMRGRLPEPVLARDKTPLARYPLAEAIRRQGLPELPPGDRVGAWVDVERLPAGPISDADLDRVVAVHALDYWLTQQRS